jgi:cation diffusion facilitator CzcD-associated flavoprotein CzcO
LLAEGYFSKIVIFEQRDNVGGLWNYTSLDDDIHAIPKIPLPQTDPYFQPHEREQVKTIPGQRPSFTTPIYDNLETNIPLELLGYTDQGWSTETALFPDHAKVLKYLERYGEDVRHLIRFSTKVVDVRPDAAQRWTVITQDVGAAGEQTAQQSASFDAVIVANGHYDVPFVPATPGMAEWDAAHPGRISHSKYFRRPESFSNQKVIVVGNAASGSDIGRQIAKYCSGPLIFSTRSENYFMPAGSGDDTYDMRPEIASYEVAERAVRFADGSVVTNVERVLYCTGYYYAYPFLKSLQNSAAPPVGDGTRVQHLYRHLFYQPAPTLIFPGLPQKVIPFTVAEAQGAVIAKVLAGKIALPSEQEMQEWEAAEIEQRGDGRTFHTQPFPDDATYINMLHDWACSVPGGKQPPRWEEKEYWVRERFPQIRAAFLKLGEARTDAHRMEDVGFDFQQWKLDEQQAKLTEDAVEHSEAA